MTRNRSRIWPVVITVTLGLTVSACGGKGNGRHNQTAPSSTASANPAASGSPSGQGKASHVFYEGFEQAGDNGWRPTINDATDAQRKNSLATIEQQPTGPIRQVTSSVRDGSHALQMTVPHALGSFRSEIAHPGVPMGSEYWYGFSIYLPPNWQVDSQSNILAQWHGRIGKDTPKTKGDGTGQPPVALAVSGGEWQMKMHWNSEGPKFEGPGSGTRTFKLGSIKTGAWVDFVMHAKWSHGSDGLVQLWKGGQQVVNYTGPDEYNNKQGPYFKIGIYHPSWKTSNASDYHKDTAATRPITVYDDDIRIAQAPATYTDVAPR
ncbi:polysaccharide lyase [Streptomyces sioyaensis]|uniref:polysaccharide lyase n=1 Tax=Streptomyces sioyaensis TaxID=67364 RepID=UPI0037A6EF0B